MIFVEGLKFVGIAKFGKSFLHLKATSWTSFGRAHVIDDVRTSCENPIENPIEAYWEFFWFNLIWKVCFWIFGKKQKSLIKKNNVSKMAIIFSSSSDTRFISVAYPINKDFAASWTHRPAAGVEWVIQNDTMNCEPRYDEV